MSKQLNLFNQISFNINRSLSDQMAQSVKQSGLSRDEVLDRMNDLADRYGVRLLKGNGQSLTMATFEKWLNPNAKEYIPSPNALVVFCGAVEDLEPMRVLLSPLGGLIIEEQDVKLLQWAKHYQRAKKERIQMRRLEPEL